MARWQIYLAGFTTACVFIVLLRHIAFKLDLVDRPTQRKTHQGNIPLVGGIAMFLALLTCDFLPGADQLLSPAFLTSMFILVVCGVLDDRFGLSVKARFLAQIVATLIIIFYSGIGVDRLGNLLGIGELILPGILMVPFTIFAVIGMINAINMMDGVDGLAGSVSCCILLVFGIAAALLDMPGRSVLAYLAAAIIGGFLAFNMRHRWRKEASVFMGDAGSMLLGLLLAWFAVVLAQRGTLPVPQRGLPPVIVLWILGFPVMETVTVMIKRIRQRHSPFEAGRDHLHHLLSRLGATETGAVFSITLLAALCGVIGLLGWLAKIPDWVMFYGFTATASIYAFIVRWLWRNLSSMAANAWHTNPVSYLPQARPVDPIENAEPVRYIENISHLQNVRRIE